MLLEIINLFLHVFVFMKMLGFFKDMANGEGFGELPNLDELKDLLEQATEPAAEE